MAKITLGKKPKNFKKTISVQMLDGTTGTGECVFKYRTKKEFGEFIDGITFDGRQPNAYLELFPIGLKGSQKIAQNAVVGG